ncbi:hypothetical protein PIB30_050417 [Stylosanthes scabra]|uniref:Uncharacterized protein n=1 Tax=Stylosanthes scabra TaxID=79078 RepID=A0ABU6XG43_9FABA|nr:hypothetical protein [Stylosanthes scabra]
MGSGVIYYEYEKRENFEEYDMRADVELGTFKIRRYHFDNESFVHPLHSVWFDPDRPYETSIEALMVDMIVSSSKDEKSSTGSSLRKPRSWELIPPSEGWMCDGDDEREIGGMEPSIKKDESIEEDPEEEDPEEEEGGIEDEEDSKEGIPASSSPPMDIDAEEDYLHCIEELEYRPEPSPLRSSQASVSDSSREASDRQSDGHNASSYDLS